MKNKIVKYVLNGVVLAAIAAIGVAAYQIGTSPTEEKFIVEMEDAETDEMAMLEEDMAEDEGVNDWDNINGEDVETGKNGFAAEDYENEYLESSEFDDEYLEKSDFDKEYLEGENLESVSVNELISTDETSEMEISGEIYDGNMENYGDTQETSVNSELIDIEVPEDDFTDVSVSSDLMSLQFSENTETQWPIQGKILLDYNMNQTIYFPTLEQYKLSPAIVVEASEGTPVFAAASGMVYDIMNNPQTGTTIIMELGDGFQAMYGQLKDLTVEEGEMIEKGTVLGYIDVPTKYYSVEGSNLYFSMKRNGEYVNPKEYLPIEEAE